MWTLTSQSHRGNRSPAEGQRHQGPRGRCASLPDPQRRPRPAPETHASDHERPPFESQVHQPPPGPGGPFRPLRRPCWSRNCSWSESVVDGKVDRYWPKDIKWNMMYLHNFYFLLFLTNVLWSVLKLFSDTIKYPKQLTGKETAMLPYSSGTTGNPKGVIVSHNSLTANMTIFRQLSSVEQTTGKNMNENG